ncbi:MAG: hypothetical protein H0T90_03505 [Gemmatimonadales bacterium]|nr:hypothetical protein [Gemmatimonadales bacterium]
MRVVDPARILFDLQPEGLAFNPDDPARLVTHYVEADRDFDGDGDQDAADAEIELQLGNWRQEVDGGLFFRLLSELNLPMSGIISPLPGFSRMAIAY